MGRRWRPVWGHGPAVWGRRAVSVGYADGKCGWRPDVRGWGAAGRSGCAYGPDRRPSPQPGGPSMSRPPVRTASPGAMRFSLLGPLTARIDGREVPLGPRKQRLVLATLLARPNTPVPVDVLTDVVWPDDPPRTARKNLQVYVSAARALIGPAGSDGRERVVHGCGATSCASRRASWTPCASGRWPVRGGRRPSGAICRARPACCVRRWTCGRGRRSTTCGTPPGWPRRRAVSRPAA